MGIFSSILKIGKQVLGGITGGDVLGAIGGYAESREARKAAERQAKADREMKEMDIAWQRENLQRQRAQQLQDRKRKESGIRGFARHYRGPALGAPAETDIGAVLAEEEGFSGRKK